MILRKQNYKVDIKNNSINIKAAISMEKKKNYFNISKHYKIKVDADSVKQQQQLQLHYQNQGCQQHYQPQLQQQQQKSRHE